MKNKFGFSLIEVMIVVVIISVLALVAVPIYRGQVDRAYTLEGHALLEEVAASEEIYKDRFGKWWDTSADSKIEDALGVNTTRNKYFKGTTKDVVKIKVVKQPTGDITKDTGEAFNVTIEGAKGSKAEGMEMKLTWYFDKPAEMTATKNGKVIRGYTT